MGRDSNSYWRFDIKAILQALILIFLIRGMTILVGYDRYVPVIDDVLNPIVQVGSEVYRSIANFFVQYFNL